MLASEIMLFPLKAGGSLPSGRAFEKKNRSCDS
jgi:hypothetical protein